MTLMSSLIEIAVLPSAPSFIDLLFLIPSDKLSYKIFTMNSNYCDSNFKKWNFAITLAIFCSPFLVT